MPKDNHPPYFPLYVDDLISDSAVDAMTNQELGIYIRFLCKAWKESPVGTIPNDEAILGKWSKESPAVWKRCRVGVLRAFVTGDDGRYHQKRMEREWEKLVAYIESKSKAGKKGMEKRWHSNGSVTNTAITGGITKDNLSESPSYSPSHSKDDDDDGALDFSILEGDARVRARAVRIQQASGVDVRNSNDRSLIAKVAVLWDAGEFSDDDIEQVLESFSAGKTRISNRAAWLHRCLANRCVGKSRDLEQMLAVTAIPLHLMFPAGVQP